MKNKGQEQNVWSEFWEGSSPQSEIQMWDYYGLRNWILKYAPRFGKVCEAGCGLGRYNFYLHKLGVNIEGLDFENQTIDYLNKWKKQNGFNDSSFIVGDVTKLPYEENSLSGYISLGVVEHFIEGPYKPINEAKRVLHPGGVAIITTPSVSWFIFYRDYLKKGLKNIVKRIIGRKIIEPEFFQYWYRPKKLKKYVEECGLKVTHFGGADLLYSFLEYVNFSDKKLLNNTFFKWIANTFENTALANIGAQSVTISVKVADIMHCFLCGELKATKKSLDKFNVPICNECSNKQNSFFYKRNKKPKLDLPYILNPPILKQEKRSCEFCDKTYTTDLLFENYGFSKNVCESCLQKKDINIALSNKNVKPIWRKRTK